MSLGRGEFREGETRSGCESRRREPGGSAGEGSGAASRLNSVPGLGWVTQPLFPGCPGCPLASALRNCGPGCAAASPHCHGNAHLSSHQDTSSLLPVFNNSQLKGNQKGTKLVTAYFRHRLLLGMNLPSLCAVPSLPSPCLTPSPPATGTRGGRCSSSLLGWLSHCSPGWLQVFPMDFIPGSTRTCLTTSPKLGTPKQLPSSNLGRVGLSVWF